MDGDVVAVNGRVTLGPRARVGGDVVSRDLPRDRAVRPPSTDGVRRSSRFDVNAGQFAAIGRFLVWIATTVSSFLLGLVLVLFVPRAADATASTAARRLGASIGFGFLMLIGIPIAAVIAMALLVGIPLGLGVLLALGLLYWLGYTVGAFALGRRLVAAPRHRMLAFLAGFGILRVLALIPVVGGLVWLGATVWGLGALVHRGPHGRPRSPTPRTGHRRRRDARRSHPRLRSSDGMTRTMVTPHTIPVLRLEGSYRDVGRQIGDACADVIAASRVVRRRAARGTDARRSARPRRRATASSRPPRCRGWSRSWTARPRAPTSTRSRCSRARSRRSGTSRARPAAERRSTGAAATWSPRRPRPPTVTCWSRHNNDLSPRYRDELVAIERSVPGDPTVFTIGNGIWISVGWNSAGLSLTGNELSPNDERIGIPRELQVRAMLRDTSLDAMVGTALRHDRASSYNNVLASSDGNVVNVEGSATSVEMTEPDERGHLVHTNHYVCDAMLPYEGDPAYARRSADPLLPRGGTARRAAGRHGDRGARCARSCRTTSTRPTPCAGTPTRTRAGSVTCFWCVADVTDMRITFGRGNPCDSVAQEFVFAD